MIRSGSLLCAVLLSLLLAPMPVASLQPDEILENPELEARARAISKGLRCVVCQNQSIDDSAAPLARDLRILVRERVLAGDTEQEVFDFVVSRYGNFVLLRPPVQINTLALWAGPIGFLLLAIGCSWYYFLVRRRTALPEDEPFSDEEKALLKSILGSRTDR